jgi:pyruvate carboxylase
MFMTANGLTAEEVIAQGDTLAFPDSVVDLFSGKLGQVEGGFPAGLSAMVLKGKQPLQGPPGEALDPVDFEADFAAFKAEFDDSLTELDFLSFEMYPDVFRGYYEHQKEFGDVHYLPTQAFFYGLKQGEEILVKLQRGKTIVIRYVYRSHTDENGFCRVTFDLNGQARSVQIRDETIVPKTAANRKAVERNEIGSPLMGRLASVLVAPGDVVSKDTPVFVIEAMKMETTITAPFESTIKAVHLQAGELVGQDDLIVELE